jgi:hypothetical protein
MDKEIVKTLEQDKVFVALLAHPNMGITYEYVMAALHPALKSHFRFYYYFGSDPSVLQTLRIDLDELPKLVFVHYNRDSYGSKDLFSIRPMDDPAESKFTDYSVLLRLLTETAQSYKLFLQMVQMSLSEWTYGDLSLAPEASYNGDSLFLILMDVRTLSLRTKTMTSKANTKP